jgi:transposase
MERTPPQPISTSECTPVNGKSATPFSPQSVVLTKQDSSRRKWEATYWRAPHACLVQREAALKAQGARLEAQVRALTQRLYGTQSENSASAEAAGQSKPASARHRGQQPGRQGHGRSDRSALPVVVAVHDVSDAAKHCPQCGEALAPLPGAAAGAISAVHVQAHSRRIQRPRYHKTCACPQVAGIVTAAPAPRVIPQSPLGVSVWTMVVLDKYLYGRPTHR